MAVAVELQTERAPGRHAQIDQAEPGIHEVEIIVEAFTSSIPSFLSHDSNALGPVDKPRPDADASEQDETEKAGGELVISGGDAPLLLEMANQALNA